jgi:hypothetical protein
MIDSLYIRNIIVKLFLKYAVFSFSGARKREQNKIHDNLRVVIQQNNEILIKGDLFGGLEDGEIAHKQRDGSPRIRDVTTM